MIKLLTLASANRDCEYIAKHARTSDINEVKVTEGNNVAIYDVLHRSRSASAFCLTWFIPSGGIPLAISGIAESPLNVDVGFPWMLGTNMMFKYPRQILIESRKFMKRALESRFKYLYNYVYDNNEPSKRYLKAIGFKLHEPEPRGPYNALFRKFDMGALQARTILSGGVVI